MNIRELRKLRKLEELGPAKHKNETTEEAHIFVIDCDTKGKSKILNRFKSLKTTVVVEDKGMYHEDESYSKILLTSFLTEEAIEEILYRGNFAYVGVGPL